MPFAVHLRDRVAEDLEKARSWDELIGVLKGQGLRLELRDRGMVITDGKCYAAASRVSRPVGLQRLERKYSQTLAAYLQEMKHLSQRARGRLRRGRSVPVGYRRARARTLSQAMQDPGALVCPPTCDEGGAATLEEECSVSPSV